MEGELKHLIMKARFEETKIRDLVDSKPKNVLSVSSVGPIQQIKVGHTPLKGGRNMEIEVDTMANLETGVGVLHVPEVALC